MVILLTALLLSSCLQGEVGSGPEVKKENATLKASKIDEIKKTDEAEPAFPPAKAVYSFIFTPLWSFETGDEVYGVALSMNGSLAAIGSSNYLYLVDEAGREVRRVKMRDGGSVQDVAMTEDGGYVAVLSYAYDDTRVHLLNTAGELFWSYTIPKLARGVDVDKRGRVAVVSYQSRLYLLKDGRIVWTRDLPRSPYGAWDVVFQQDRLIVGDDNGDMYIFNLEGKVSWKTKVKRKDYVYGVAASSGGYLAAVTQGGGVHVYKNGRLTWKRTTGFSNYGVAISEELGLVAVGSWDKNLYIYDIKGKLFLKRQEKSEINRVDFSGDRLIYGSKDGTANLLKIVRREEP